MNDNHKLAERLESRADYYRLQPGTRDLLLEAAAALRACDADLATARAVLAEQNADTDALLDKLMDGEGELRDTIRAAATVTQRLIRVADRGGPSTWRDFVDSDAERAWLASAVPPPTSGDDG